jgi:hypothetical protein
MTAHANDGGWATALPEVARPFLIASTGPGWKATLLLISSSGKSENIVGLAKLGATFGHRIIAMTGFDGEPLRSLATLSLHVNSRDYEVVEPVHDALIHRIQYHIRTRGITNPSEKDLFLAKQSSLESSER